MWTPGWTRSRPWPTSSSAVGYERRNVTTFIKRWAHERIRAESLPQFMLACLPADRSLWRAGTHDLRMRKANQLVTELVTEQLSRPGSPMPAAMEKIVDYADERRRIEALDIEGWQKLVDAGRSRIVERAVNGVYQMLRSLPASQLNVRTPMLEVMAMDYEQMAVMAADRTQDQPVIDEDDDLVSFGLRLRSYSSRLEHHRNKAGIYRDLSRQWERAEKARVAAEDSKPLYEFYRFEEDYHVQLVSKYQHFLPFLGDAGQWYEQQQELARYGQQLLALIAMRNDASLQRMKDEEEAEQVGREVYDQAGGRNLTRGRAGRAVLDQRIVTMTAVYDERLDTLCQDLASSGLVLRPAGVDDMDDQRPAGAAGLPTPTIVPGTQHPFDEVKALDLHHLGYDFVTDVPVGDKAAQAFLRASRERRTRLLGAMAYLDDSGQSAAISDLPVDDVAAMTRVARELSAQHSPDEPTTATSHLLLRSRIAELRSERDDLLDMRRSRTASLDSGLVTVLQAEVDQAVARSMPELKAGSGQSTPQPG